MKRKLSVFLLIISIAMIGVGGYLYFNNTKNQMLSVISSQIDLLQKRRKTVEKEKAQYITSATVKENNNLLGSVSGDIYVDENSSKYYLKLATKLAEELGAKEALSELPEIYIEGNKLYFKLQNETYYIDIFETSGNGSSSNGLSDDMMDILLKTTVEKIPENNFSKENVKATILNSEIETEKYTVFLTSTDIYNITESILNEIDNNAKLKSFKEVILASNSKKEILDGISQALNTLYGKNEKIITYSVYVKNNEIIKHEINMAGNTIDNSQKSDLKITLSKKERATNLFDYELLVTLGSENIVEASLTGEDKLRKISVKTSTIGMELEGTITKDNSTTKTVVDVYNSSDKAKPVISYKYDYNEVIAGSEYSSNLNITVYNSTNVISIECVSKILKGKGVPSFDTSSAKKFDLNSNSGAFNKYLSNSL